MANALLPSTLVLAIAFSQAVVSAEKDSDFHERLLAGDIVAQETSSDETGAAGHMRVLIKAPARVIWEVIVSCDLAYAFVDGLRECEVLEDTGDRARVHQVVDQGWLSPTYDYEFESLRRRYERIDVHLLAGNLKALDGYWVFDETAEGTMVDYEIRIQPSLPAPRFIVRRNISKGMPGMLACIRGLAGGSGSAELLQQDLDRCPGPIPARNLPIQ